MVVAVVVIVVVKVHVKKVFMEIFGKNIELKTHYCQYFNCNPSKIEQPYINLYVRFKGCNANCKFCTFMNSAHTFDFKKYDEIINELSTKLHIRKIGFTGGEPTLQYELFKDVLKYSSDKLGKNTEMSVNSNGINFKKIYTDGTIKYIDKLHLSRHHYEDYLNNIILDFDALSTEEIKELQKDIVDPNFLQFSCNLIKGYIDNNFEIQTFLDFANDVNVHQVGFVSLMDVNDYTKSHYISNDMHIFNKLYKTKQWNNKGFCECSNYIYVPTKLNTHCVKLYKKNTYNTSNLNNTLTFNGKNLVVGFDDKQIIY